MAIKQIKDSLPVEELAKQYVEYREQAKEIKARMDSIAKTLKDYAETNGVKDSNGSYYTELNGIKVGKQAKTTVKFTDNAINYLKSNLSGAELEAVIKTQEYIDEKEFESLVNEGKISDSDILQITESKVTYAIDVKVLADMPEVEQSEIPKAASTKPHFVKK